MDMSDEPTCCRALKINSELTQMDTNTIFAKREQQTVKELSTLPLLTSMTKPFIWHLKTDQ
jgi:hypothetical protein